MAPVRSRTGRPPRGGTAPVACGPRAGGPVRADPAVVSGAGQSPFLGFSERLQTEAECHRFRAVMVAVLLLRFRGGGSPVLRSPLFWGIPLPVFGDRVVVELLVRTSPQRGWRPWWSARHRRGSARSGDLFGKTRPLLLSASLRTWEKENRKRERRNIPAFGGTAGTRRCPALFAIPFPICGEHRGKDFRNCCPPAAAVRGILCPVNPLFLGSGAREGRRGGDGGAPGGAVRAAGGTGGQEGRLRAVGRGTAARSRRGRATSSRCAPRGSSRPVSWSAAARRRPRSCRSPGR